ncbi:MAG: hypothetical protein CTY12_08720 [Methylotenera sp.]|nr:MAG: hypothetical protein CTY12_08720 [Methylotenera sp.]
MLLTDLLVEKANVSSDIEERFVRAIDKWIEWLKATGEFDENQKPSLDRKQWREYSVKLQRIIQPTINKILNDNLYIDDSNSDENCLGFKLSAKVEVDHYYDTSVSSTGSVSGNWSKYWTTKPKYFYGAIYEIDIPPTLVYHLVNGSEKAKLSLLATMTHEIVHVMQLARTKIRRNRAKQGMARNKMDNDQRYYLDKVELSAYAQGTVTKIMTKAKTMPNGVEWVKTSILPMIKMGMNSVFGREVFPSQQYEEIRNLCKQPTDDPKMKRWQQQAWRYFNKHIYDKLIERIS